MLAPTLQSRLASSKKSLCVQLGRQRCSTRLQLAVLLRLHPLAHPSDPTPHPTPPPTHIHPHPSVLLCVCSSVAAELLVLFINFQNDLSARLTNPCTYPCTGANLGQERVGLGIPPGYRCVHPTGSVHACVHPTAQSTRMCIPLLGPRVLASHCSVHVCVEGRAAGPRSS